jgi:hypothetical protein
MAEETLMGIPVGGTLRIRKRYAVTHGQFPNQLPPTELLGLWRCEGDFATAIGLLNTALFGTLLSRQSR